MMFVCPELEKLSAKEAILQSLTEVNSAKLLKYDTPTGNFAWFFQAFTRKKSTEYLHANILVKKFLQSNRRLRSLHTNAQAMSNYGISLSDYSGSSAYSFYHNYRKPLEHYSGLYYTVYTETGIILTKPVRFTGAVNRGIINQDQIIGQTINGVTSFNYQGESGADYTIESDNTIVQPITMDSTLKSLALNKYNSLCDIIEFSSGLDCQPGDYCQYLTNTYVILSRKPGANNINIFVAVQESANTYTITGSNAAPDIVEYDTKTPQGFVNRTDSTITYNASTRTFTISGTFEYWHQGNKYRKYAVTESVVHGTDIGQYFVYYSGNTLTVSAVNTHYSILTDTGVAIIYYNGTATSSPWTGPSGFVMDERHGTGMSPANHKWKHLNNGAYIPTSSDFAISGITLSSSADITYGIAAGTIADEDLETALTELADNGGTGNVYPIFYRNGATEWRWSEQAKTVIFTSVNPYYNQLSGSSYQLTAINTNNTYFNMYVCAIPFLVSSSGTSYKFIWIMGQTTYSTLAAAQGELLTTNNLANFPSAELAGLYQVTYKFVTAGGGATTIEGYKNIINTIKFVNGGGSVVQFVPQILIVNETQNAGTAGGTFTSGADRVRVLNTVLVNSIPGASLDTANNRIILPIGTYKIYGSCPAYNVGIHQSMVYNVGAAANIQRGTPEYSNSNTHQTRSVINGYIVITSTASSNNAIEIRHRCGSTLSTNGFGVDANLTYNVFTEITIEKVG